MTLSFSGFPFDNSAPATVSGSGSPSPVDAAAKQSSQPNYIVSATQKNMSSAMTASFWTTAAAVATAWTALIVMIPGKMHLFKRSFGGQFPGERATYVVCLVALLLAGISITVSLASQHKSTKSLSAMQKMGLESNENQKKEIKTIVMSSVASIGGSAAAIIALAVCVAQISKGEELVDSLVKALGGKKGSSSKSIRNVVWGLVLALAIGALGTSIAPAAVYGPLMK